MVRSKGNKSARGRECLLVRRRVGSKILVGQKRLRRADW